MIKNERMIKYASENNVTVGELEKLAFADGFFDGIEKELGKKKRDLIEKTASEFYEKNPDKDFIEELINDVDSKKE